MAGELEQTQQTVLQVRRRKPPKVPWGAPPLELVTANAVHAMMVNITALEAFEDVDAKQIERMAERNLAIMTALVHNHEDPVQQKIGMQACRELLHHYGRKRAADGEKRLATPNWEVLNKLPPRDKSA